MRRKFFELAIIILLIVLSAGGLWLLNRSYYTERTTPDSSNESEKPKLVAVTSRWLIMGDVFWARSMHKWSQASTLGYAYPFSGLSSFGRENYDAWIANLECPITDRGVNQSEQATLLKFNCPPESLPEAAKWFTAFSLANNHTDNQNGLIGLAQTRQHLEQSGIQSFGHYEPGRVNELCEVLGIAVKARYNDGSIQTGRLPVAFCGYHTVFRTATQPEIDTISRYGAVLPTIVMAHSGAEYKPSHDSIKERQFRSMVDAGATAVFGEHLNWVQDSQAYKGKINC